MKMVYFGISKISARSNIPGLHFLHNFNEKIKFTQVSNNHKCL